jgi:hypothetical protein
MACSMTARSNGSTRPSALPPAIHAKPAAFSTLPEHMQQRERLNTALKAKMLKRCQNQGIKTL